MERRLDLCAAKGFDGVEADNVDGYANDTGFPLTRGRPARLQPLPGRARRTPAACRSGSRTTSTRSRELEPDFDWALNEQCFQYDECEPCAPFIARRQGGVRRRVRARDRATFCAQAARGRDHGDAQATGARRLARAVLVTTGTTQYWVGPPAATAPVVPALTYCHW